MLTSVEDDAAVADGCRGQAALLLQLTAIEDDAVLQQGAKVEWRC